MLVSLKFIKEETAGEKWLSTFRKTWPHYEAWYLSEGATARPGYLTCSEKFKQHMPEIYDVYKHLCELSGGGDLISRYLSMYKPPAYLSGCTQVVWTKGEIALLRNYDYHPRLFEGVMLYSNWLKPVIGISDCNWGLLDGINSDGLAVSLTFGGRKVIGDGFGIPVILRYILETCCTTAQAVTVLKRIPIHMAYNISIVDRKGANKAVFLGPDRKPLVSDAKICTNHQGTIDWPEYALISATLERESHLKGLMNTKGITLESLKDNFLQAPLYDLRSERSFATLYTAAYFPKKNEVQVMWPGRMVKQSFTNFEEKREILNLKKSVSGKLAL